MRLFEITDRSLSLSKILNEMNRDNDYWNQYNYLFENIPGKSDKNVIIRACDSFISILKKYTHSKNINPDIFSNSSDRIIRRIAEFVEYKKNNPNAPFGSKDLPFSTANKLARIEGKLILHCHLTHDISLVYVKHGMDNMYIDLIHIGSHDDLGTGGKHKIVDKTVNYIRDKLQHDNFNNVITSKYPLDNNSVKEATFFGSPCKTPTCQGHTAGFIYQMKKKNKVLPGTPSPSFNNGAAIAQNQMDTKRVRNPKQGIKDTKGRFMKIPPVPTIK